MSTKQSQRNQGFLTESELVTEKRDLKKPVNDKAWGLLNGTQLWFIYLGLGRLKLVPDLRIGVSDLARRIKRYGVRVHGWSS